jgi:3-methyladenine DNA glycosylase Mpg
MSLLFISLLKQVGIIVGKNKHAKIIPLLAHLFVGLENGSVICLNVVSENEPFLSAFQVRAVDTHGEENRKAARESSVLDIIYLQHGKPGLLIAYRHVRHELCTRDDDDGDDDDDDEKNPKHTPVVKLHCYV